MKACSAFDWFVAFLADIRVRRGDSVTTQRNLFLQLWWSGVSGDLLIHNELVPLFQVRLFLADHYLLDFDELGKRYTFSGRSRRGFVSQRCLVNSLFDSLVSDKFDLVDSRRNAVFVRLRIVAITRRLAHWRLLVQVDRFIIRELGLSFYSEVRIAWGIGVRFFPRRWGHRGLFSEIKAVSLVGDKPVSLFLFRLTLRRVTLLLRGAPPAIYSVACRVRINSI